MSARSTVHALLVAIDNYPVPHHKLNGCVNDRDAFAEYLQRRFSEPGAGRLRLKTLTDKEATKKGIIDAFQQHFRSAKKGDTCVFYFSGHGSRAPSPREFWHLSPDRMNQSLVCWDSRIPGGLDLMDKELRFLLWRATFRKDIHFLALFDCCHSGTITKSVIESVTARMAEPSPVPSRLEDYLGFESYEKKRIKGETYYTPKKGKVVQLSASKDDETAKELRIDGKSRGIFTYNLVEMLEQTGSLLTYSELTRILQARIVNRVRDQTPQLEAEPKDASRLFLGGLMPPAPPYFRVNHVKGQWRIDAGRVQGIPDSGGTLLLDDEKTELTIDQVEANTSTVRGMEGKNINLSYRAFVKQLALPRTRLAFAKGSDAEAVKNIRQTLQTHGSNYLNLVDKTDQAEYLIWADDNTLRLSLPNDDRPVFRRLPGYDPAAALKFIREAEAVAKWGNLLRLNNERSTIRDNDIAIELYQLADNDRFTEDDPDVEVDWRKPSPFHYDFINDKWEPPSFRMKVRNNSQRTLYFSALFMGADYEITNKFLPRQQLNAGEEAWLTDRDSNTGDEFRTLGLFFNENFSSWGVTEIKEYIKLIVSTDPLLNTDSYNQDALEMDVKKIAARSAGARQPAANRPDAHDWTTREIELTVVHPLDHQPLVGGRSLSVLDNIQIKAPAGLQAKVGFATQQEGTRSLSAPAPAPEQFWGRQEEAQPYAFTDGAFNTPPLSVLEMHQVQGAHLVNADDPLVLSLNRVLAEGERIVPIGYDPQSGLYYPLGLSDENGEILIEALPDESPSGTRSLGGSIKIFFQKVVLSKLGFAYKHPQLAQAVFKTEDGTEFEYLTDTAKVKMAVREAKRIALFIHGIIGDTLAMPPALRLPAGDNGDTLEKYFDLALTFDYENLKTNISQTGRDLGARLAEVGLAPGHDKELTIIAHSMGGLVSRWFIEKEGGHQVVSRLIQVGTPNAGSPWSSVYEMASVLLSRAVNGAAFIKPYVIPLSLVGKLLDTMFTTLSEMHPDKSDFLKTLNDGTDPGISYTIVAGNTQLIPAVQEDNFRSLLRKVLARFQGRAHYDLLDRLLFKSPNDIAVSVDSIGGIADAAKWMKPPRVIPVACDHISYFVDPEGLIALSLALSDDEASEAMPTARTLRSKGSGDG
jgi:pimeloyl-ACP methyl ester carboxylesterase